MEQTNNPVSDITLIVDFQGTSEENEALVKKLVEYQQNGVEIYICTTSELGEEEKLKFEHAGLKLDREKHYLEKAGKHLPYWKALPEQLSRSKEKMIVLDDNRITCMQATGAGLTAIHWNKENNIHHIGELDELMKEKGYQPS